MIKLFTDTSANLPVSITYPNGIKVGSFNYTINGTPVPYYEGIDFDGVTFYANMREGAKVVTSLVSTGTYQQLFEEALSNGDDVLLISMSSGISGAFNSARLAAEELQEKYPDRRIELFDSYAASLGEGLFVIKALEMIKDGKSLDEILQWLYANRDKMCQYFTVDDLKYLKNTGRVSATTAFIGNALAIKPILTGDATGHIVVIDKSRGLKNSLKDLANRYNELIADKTSTIAIAHCDNNDGTEYLINLLKEKGHTGEIMVQVYEPVTGSHVGPGSIALFFFGIHK